jgi:tripartite-type tricarboxylate transporter receptor subunit TctC
MRGIGRRTALAWAAAWPLPALAQGGQPDFPSRPITIIVQYPPGGSTDIAARMLQPGLSAALGQPVVVENRPGGAGNIGFDAVARARPDGHTLLVTNLGPITVSPHTLATLSIDPMTALVPVALVNRTPMMAAVHPAVPHASLAAFADWAKRQDGKASFGNSGQGAIGHIAMTMIAMRLGIAIEQVPYRGIALALQDLVAGRISGVMDSLVSSQALVREGKAAGLFVTGETRSPFLPQVPTLMESGMPDVAFYGWNGLFAPTGTPDAVVDALHAAANRALAEPAVAERIRGVGSEPGQASRADFARMVRDDHARWGEVVKRAGIRVE